MPFRSERQRRFLWLRHPDIARRWAHEAKKQEKTKATKTTKVSKSAFGIDHAFGVNHQ